MTQVLIGLENNLDYGRRSLAWALDFPGCFAYGKDGDEAILSLPRAMVNYRNWIGQRAEQDWLSELGHLDYRLSEVWDCYALNESFELDPAAYEINAWFRHDWRPLTSEDVLHGLQMLSWTRQDLLDLVTELTPAQLDRQREDERWSIRGILGHVAGAEWWYLDRLGLAGMAREELPKDPFERLPLVRARLQAVLPELVGREDLVRGKDGEFWSPRKLLRRALWHERDHWMHISKLVLEA